MSHRRITLTAFALAACSTSVEDAEPSADAPRYYEDVLPIMQRACIGCHTEGTVAPFALDDYDSAREWAAAIEASVTARTMPPFLVDASGECGDFRHQQWLDDDEIDTISRWVEHGAPEGDPASAPPPVEPAGLDGLVVEAAMPLDYTPIASDGTDGDEYRCFRLEPAASADMWITGFEVEPGNEDLVHHVVVYIVDPEEMAFGPGGAAPETNGEMMDRLEAEDGRPGWDCFFGSGGPRGEMPAIWTPGTGTIRYPDGLGVKLPEGAVLVAEMHYFEPDGTATDRTRVRLQLEESVERRGALVLSDGLVDTLFAGMPEVLPPGEPSLRFSWSNGMDDLLWGLPGRPTAPPEFLDVYGIFPHMHELGASMSARFEGPTGTQCAAEIPRWDFEWQTVYFYDQPLRFGAADTLHVDCEFDTTGRTEPTLAGFETKNEMCSFGLFVGLPLE